MAAAVGTAVLAIDQGTTNTKALLFSVDGGLVAQASRPTGVSHPRPGWAEQSAATIWRSTADVIAEAIACAGGWNVAAIGIANQRESVVLWDARTGEPLGPCILWQCRRTSDRCAELRASGAEPLLVERTGLGIDPLFSATKLAWLIDSVPDGRARAARGEIRGGTIDSWLLWNLTGGVHATDHSNAARTQLLRLDTLTWDSELADLFGVPLPILPAVHASDDLFGVTAAGATALPPGVPIHAVMGDSHAAMFGHGIDRPGGVKVTLGTGSSLMSPIGPRVSSTHGLSSTIAWSRGDAVLYALEGNISVSGQAAAFMTRMLGFADEGALSALAASVPDSGGVSFVPALAGLGAPHWRDRARGLVSGMTLATTPAHLARACLEAIALQIRDVFDAVEQDLGRRLGLLSVDGGAARNDLLLQILADVLDRPVVRPDETELSARGVAAMATSGCGYDLPAPSPARRFAPLMGDGDRAALLAHWNDAVARTSHNT